MRRHIKNTTDRHIVMVRIRSVFPPKKKLSHEQITFCGIWCTSFIFNLPSTCMTSSLNRYLFLNKCRMSSENRVELFSAAIIIVTYHWCPQDTEHACSHEKAIFSHSKTDNFWAHSTKFKTCRTNFSHCCCNMTSCERCDYSARSVISSALWLSNCC